MAKLMNIEELKSLLNKVEVEGCVEISSGLYLNSRENILADQINWDEGDSCKTMDFSKFKYWITTNNGRDPIGIDKFEELCGHLDIG